MDARPRGSRHWKSGISFPTGQTRLPLTGTVSLMRYFTRDRGSAKSSGPISDVLLLLSSAYVSDERDWSVVKIFENQIWCYNASKTRNFPQHPSTKYGLYARHNIFQGIHRPFSVRGAPYQRQSTADFVSPLGAWPLQPTSFPSLVRGVHRHFPQSQPQPSLFNSLSFHLRNWLVFV